MFWAGIAVGLIVAVVLLYLAAMVAAAMFFVSPVRIVQWYSPAMSGIPQQDFEVRTVDDVPIRGWIVTGESDAVIVFTHGYMMNRCEFAPYAQMLRDQGLGTVYFDTRAHGRSGGKRVGIGFAEQADVRSVLDELRRTLPGKRFVLVGSSMGSVASIYASLDRPEDIAGLVLDAEKSVADDSTQPTLFDLVEGDGSKTGPAIQFKNRTGKPSVQKMDRNSTVQKVDWEDDSETGLDERSKNGPETVQEVDCLEFKKRTDIKTTNLNNTPKQQQTDGGDVVAGGGLSLALLIGKLMAEGIEATTAAKLVENFPAEQIVRQIEALPSRKIKSSRTGFLIRAIEMDIPVENHGVSKDSPARAMAAHFYAELGGNQDEPVSHVSTSDDDAATSLLGRIPQELQAEGRAIGRDFGRYIRKKQEGSKFPIRTLSLAVRSYGDEFVASRRDKFEADRKRKLQEAKEAHEKQSQSAYQEFLGGLAARIEKSEPELWDRFNTWLTNKVERRKRMSETIYRRTLEEIESPGGKTPFLIEFLSESRPELAPSFWEWDAKFNPRPFTTEGKRP